MIDINLNNESIGQFEEYISKLPDATVKTEPYKEQVEAEYYMRRHNNFYFRTGTLKLKTTVSDESKEKLIEQLSYGDTVMIEMERQ